MTKQTVVEKITDIAESVLHSLDMELVDLEYTREGRQMVLRLFIDKEGGITLDDCASVSRELSAILDVEDVVAEKYILEVSSPGLNRPLKTEADYRRYLGRLVKIKTYDALVDEGGNKRKTFLGELLTYDNNVVSLRLREGQRVDIPLDKIAKANLEFEF